MTNNVNYSHPYKYLSVRTGRGGPFNDYVLSFPPSSNKLEWNDLSWWWIKKNNNYLSFPAGWFSCFISRFKRCTSPLGWGQKTTFNFTANPTIVSCFSRLQGNSRTMPHGCRRSLTGMRPSALTPEWNGSHIWNWAGLSLIFVPLREQGAELTVSPSLFPFSHLSLQSPICIIRDAQIFTPKTHCNLIFCNFLPFAMPIFFPCILHFYLPYNLPSL